MWFVSQKDNCNVVIRWMPIEQIKNMTIYPEFLKEEIYHLDGSFYFQGVNMIEVKFYDQVADELLKFAVIIAKTEEKWVFCKHKERSTYEVPGGHREVGETILDAAKRELKEETGAVDFEIRPVCVYSVKGKTRINKQEEDESFGMLFIAEITSFEELHSEIETILITDMLVENWTYPLIQPKLLEEAERRGLI